MKDIENMLQLLHDDKKQYIGDITKCPTSKLGVCDLMSVNEISKAM